MEWHRSIARIAPGDGSHGTGFLISDRLVLTGFHVVGKLQESIDAKTPVWRGGTLEVSFGNPQAAETIWKPAAVSIVKDRYSFDDDWALLEISQATEGKPLPLAQYTGRDTSGEFFTFGFPGRAPELGDAYHGRILWWHDSNAQLDAANLLADVKGGEDPGGISGAPVVVGNRAVGVILRSLANARDLAISRSLYVLPVGRVARKLGIEWDDGTPEHFQNLVEQRLPPNDLLRLAAAADVLGIPGITERPPIAKRMLKSTLDVAREALVACTLEPDPAAPILERVAAMQFDDSSVAHLRTSRELAIVASEDAKIHKWYVQRAFVDRVPLSDRTIVVLRAREENEEPPPGKSIVEEVCARVAKALSNRRIAAADIEAWLSPTHDPELEIELFVVFVGETRPNVVQDLKTRIPNACLILGLADPAKFTPFDGIAFPILSVMPKAEQQKLIGAFRKAFRKLNIPWPVEEDP